MLSAYLDGRVFGDEYGTPPPSVLALHGWRRTHTDFARVFAASDGDEVGALALDLPGFGASPPPGDAWGAAEYAAALYPILDSMREKVIVVGHSFGGRVAVELAAARPDRVGALVLCGVPVMNAGAARPKPKLEYRVIRALARLGLVSGERLERARERFGSEDYRVARGVMRSVLVRVLAEDYRSALAQVSCPIELVWGELDTVVPVAIARAALDSIADGRLTVLPGIGHLVPTAAPGQLRDVVASHLA